jgi:hypothetical protein
MKRIAISASFLLIVTAACVLSYNSYLSSFNNLYSTAGTRLDDCSTCHTSSGFALNPYGDDVLTSLNQLGDIAAALQAVENIDSDGDGDNNIAEIRAFTFPGDAGSSLPVEQKTWGALKHMYQ